MSKEAAAPTSRTVLTAKASKFALRKKPDYILSEESALDQVLDFLAYYDIDVEKSPVDVKTGTKPLETSLEQLTEYVRRGTVEITRTKDQDVQVTVNLSAGNEMLVFGKLGAKHKLVMDKVADGGGYSRIYALMGSLCGYGTMGIEKLPAQDLAVIEVLGMVFLAA